MIECKIGQHNKMDETMALITLRLLANCLPKIYVEINMKAYPIEHYHFSTLKHIQIRRPARVQVRLQSLTAQILYQDSIASFLELIDQVGPSGLCIY